MSTTVEQEAEPLAPALETAIALEAEDPRAKAVLVWGHLRGADVFILARMAGDQQIAEVLYFTTPGPGGRREDDIPVFTRLAFLRQAVERNPAWRKYVPVVVGGGELMEAVDANAIVINPWSHLQYRVPTLVQALYQSA